MSNDTISKEEVYHHLLNWNFAWNIVLTVIIIVLQYGHWQYSRVLYGFKMAVLWLLWPLVFALSIFDCVVNFNSNWVFFAFSLLMSFITGVVWLMYFINSFRLYRRVRSFWAFNPETNAVISVHVLGFQYVQPVLAVPTGITLTLLNGNLLIDGFKVASGVQISNLPQYLTVAKPNTTIIYERAGRSLNATYNSGWVFYVKSKFGDYSAAIGTHSNMSDAEKVLHLV
ncbi:M protein [NL63-related bat coronavirus]|uniref:Membrane protein n=1 Tax=NL63-related bat coronavirus TaxID=1920748 RepID=A0A1L2KGC5_9ALPC|nr:M protein [NL63-related bat coronavirus]APD51486.1 M protein [NL63-related bat coronavirus]